MPNSREEHIFHLINKSGAGLEIGPSYNPIAPRRDGWNVEIADHLDAQSLRSKYAAWGVDGSAIESVNYVVGSDGLYAAIGEKSRFDFILASHVIEHVPDIVQFLIDCELLLKPEGIISLVIPDKRFCFDILKPLSSTGQALQAHLERRSKHNAGTIFDAHALHVKNGTEIVWPRGSEVNNLNFVHSVIESQKIMSNCLDKGESIDVHAWQFIPASLEIIISDLIEMGLIQLELAASFDTASHEFYVSLRKSKNPNRLTAQDRIRLAKIAAADGVMFGKHEPVAVIPTSDRTVMGYVRALKTWAQMIPVQNRLSAETSLQVNKKTHLFEHKGYCPICEAGQLFVSENKWFRDYLLCSGCLSIPRERALMKVLSELKPNWRNLAMHESSPADRGASKKLHSECSEYLSSQYNPSFSIGQTHPTLNYRNENLENQTFLNESFDIVITQDVFEHITNPAAAIKEISRTLKPGGVHIASIPLVRKWEPSLTRARQTLNGEIEHMLAPEYHGNPISEKGSLVVTDWGYDIGGFFKENSEMDTIIYNIDNGIRAEYIEIVVSMKKLAC